MQDSVAFDELELQLINALQLNPRAPWNLIGEVLGVDPVTVARRWDRLTAAGLAWITVYRAQLSLGTVIGACIEVRCAAGKAGAVADRLCHDRRVGTIEHITGDSDLLLTVFAPGLADLSTYVLTSLGRIRGVRDCRTHVMTAIHAEGSRWELRALDPLLGNRIRASRPDPQPAPRQPIGPRDAALLTALERNGRAGFAELAADSGVSVSTARRRVSSLIAAQHITLRCEVAQPMSGWPISATLWCRVAPNRLDTVAGQLATLPETRLCASVTGGRANLMISVWLRSAGDIHRLQAALAEQVSEVEVVDVALALRHVKRLGRLLDDRGRATDFVPLDIWPH
ncbi:Lrp/AsnC family transcriptional regulator [Nocardia arthritidis]|uniref:AsnC family transcriptional regulator n=1 Tax=Nocardia arthritidis TaxID=228602 RepID=A0A6G9YGV3_9NOCA|nr:Lrp/AsnC family transcriptional regulator [Nocardia arthritidis]QIS12414.1 AsnC family transcriptional regulator [Nocardia arthritidis]